MIYFFLNFAVLPFNTEASLQMKGKFYVENVVGRQTVAHWL